MRLVPIKNGVYILEEVSFYISLRYSYSYLLSIYLQQNLISIWPLICTQHEFTKPFSDTLLF